MTSLKYKSTSLKNKLWVARSISLVLNSLDYDFPILTFVIIISNIDVRIRQAELEYALGREELQLLSIVEEARALQARLEKSKVEPQSVFR